MRYRDLETGTFLTRDPQGYGDGPNLYCYVHCNPITQFDALGLETTVAHHNQGSRFWTSKFNVYKDPGDPGFKEHWVDPNTGEPMVHSRSYERVSFPGFSIGPKLNDTGWEDRPAQGAVEKSFFQTDSSGVLSATACDQAAENAFYQGADEQIGAYSDKVEQMSKMSASSAVGGVYGGVTAGMSLGGKFTVELGKSLGESVFNQQLEKGEISAYDTFVDTVLSVGQWGMSTSLDAVIDDSVSGMIFSKTFEKTMSFVCDQVGEQAKETHEANQPLTTEDE